MPDKYRVPLVLLYFSEMSYDQIAQELELTRSHVGVLLLRAKQHLRNQLLELEKLKESNP
jgi:RNA polymerase sigma factor (sigma-70 family)